MSRGRVRRAVVDVIDHGKLLGLGDDDHVLYDVGGTTDHGSLTGLADDDHVNYVHLVNARTITGQHSFSPGSAQAPFLLGANAQSQLVVGLRADQLNKQVIAGAGMTGGGTLISDQTLNVIAGNGIVVNAGNVAVDLAAASGLGFSSGDLTVHDSIAGDGLGITAKVLRVKAGDGLEILSDEVVIDLRVPSGLAFVAGDLEISDTIAGNGLDITSKVMNVKVGDGLEIVTDTVRLDIASPSGLDISTGQLLLDDSVAGSGLNIAAKVLSVDVADFGSGMTGDGLVWDAGNTEIDLGTPGTSTVSTSNAVTASSHTHDVTTSSNPGASAIILQSNTNGYLELERLGVGVAPVYYLHARGIVQPQLRLEYDVSNYTNFNQQADGDLEILPVTDLILTPGGGEVVINADLGINVIAPAYALQVRDTALPQVRIEYDASNRLDISISSGGNATLAPTGDLLFDPTGNDVYPTTGYDLNLGTLQKKWLTLHAAELWVETLVAQNTIATIGGRILVGPTTTLTTDLAAATTTISVEHNQMVSGDRVYMEADGKVEFMSIDSAPGGGGPYTYTVTRNLDGTGANDWFAGDAMFNTGTTDDGFIDLYSFSGVTSGTVGPTIVGNVRQSATYNDWVEHWAIGNLNGLYGYGVDTYGAAFGDYEEAYMTIDPTSGIRFFDTTDGILGQLTGTALTFGNNAPTTGAEELLNAGFETVVTIGSELILNPGFETPGGGGADIWANWTEVAGTGTLQNDTLVKHSGNDAARCIAGATPNDNTIRQQWTVNESSSYRISFWVWADGTNAGQYRVRDITGAANIIGRTSTGHTAASWLQITVDVVAPSGCKIIQLGLYSPSSPATAWNTFDDVSALQLGFTNWTMVDNGDGGTSVDTISHAGTYSARVRRYALGQEVELTQTFTPVAFQLYRLQFWTRGDGTNAGDYRVSYSGGDIIPETTTGVTGTTFTLVTDYFMSPSSGDVTLAFRAKDGVFGALARYDDVSIVPFDDATRVQVSAANGIRFFNSATEVVGQWIDNRIVLGSTGEENITINPYGVRIKNGAVIYAQLIGDALTLGLTEDQHVAVDPTNGIRFFASDGSTVLGQWIGSDITLGVATAEHIGIDTTNGLRFFADDGTTVLGQWDGDVVTIGLTTAEHITLETTNGLRFFADDGTTVIGQWNGAVVTIGVSTTEHVLIDTNGVSIIDDGGFTAIQLDTSGNAIFGTVATDQANVFWNASNKRLEFRAGTSGTQVRSYIDTNGAFVIDTTTAFSTDRAIRFVSSAGNAGSVFGYYLDTDPDQWGIEMREEDAKAYVQTIKSTATGYEARLVAEDKVLLWATGATGSIAFSGEVDNLWGDWNRTTDYNTTTAVAQTVTWENEDFDTDSMWTSGTDINPSTAGRYLVIGSATWASNSAGRRAILLRKNGSTVRENRIAAVNGSATFMECMTIIDCNGTTDDIAMQVRQNSGSSILCTVMRIQVIRMS